jgi:monoterpene epsilon-lactone hydrolase
MIPRGVRWEELGAGPPRGEALHVDAPRDALPSLHGGGYVAGHPRVYRNLGTRVAKRLSADVFVPEYRLAPEHPFPAALEETRAAFETVLARGFSPRAVTAIGDAAGGRLSLALLLALSDADAALPKCAVVLSPLADLRFVNKSARGKLPQGRHAVRAHADARCRPLPGTRPVDDPLISPALGEYSVFCPLLVTVCEAECLRDDAYAVVAQAKRAGVPVELISCPGLRHVWPIFTPLIREAREDFELIARFIARQG